MTLVRAMMTFRKYLAFGLVGLMTSGTTSVLAAGGEAAGLPQLDIATWPSQLFWLVVLFGAGYLVMSRMITPRIGNVLEQRGRTIQDDLNRAKEAEAEAQTMKAEFEASLDDARTKAADAAQKAMSEAKAKAEESEAELSAKLAKKTKAAETKLAKIRDEALANINEVASEITQDAVKAVTGMTVTKAEATKSVAKLAKAGAGQEA
ncbi:MAG: F0F1 ATP synthase subunit B' [Alphaproteobacteria bacterium]|nr:F0F1 ATP synthase subunit B' [Alphaproteobacteria bacterium]